MHFYVCRSILAENSEIDLGNKSMKKSAGAISLNNSVWYKVSTNKFFLNICKNLGKLSGLNLSNLEPNIEQKKSKTDKEKLSSTFTSGISNVKYKFYYLNTKYI